MVLGLFLWSARPLVPRQVRRQLDFVALVPDSSQAAIIDRTSVKYDSSNKVLSYEAKYQSSRLIVTNQAAPETFSDVPKVYDKFLEDLHAYTSFDSSLGKVSLTRPPKADSQQVAIISTKGTLMFVRANHDLSNDQWRKFFNNLQTVK